MSENNQTESKRGGARKGAGRKPGSATKKTREIADRAADEGITPLEVMLDNMRFAHGGASEMMNALLRAAEGADIPEGFDALEKLAVFRRMAQDAAKDAAPYMHPRLATVEHRGDEDNPIQHSVKVTFG